MTVNEQSDRGQSQVADSVTVSAAHIDAAHSQEGECLAIRRPGQPVTDRARVSPPARGYVAPMGTADTVAAIMREHLSTRITNVTDRKIHALLYLVQLSSFTADDEPLFDNPITATSTGVEIGGLSGEQHDPTDVEFSSAVHVAGRYGGLATTELEALIRGQAPWQNANGGEITMESVRSWARSFDDDPEATVSGATRTWLKAFRAARPPVVHGDAKPDTQEEIAAFVADHLARQAGK